MMSKEMDAMKRRKRNLDLLWNKLQAIEDAVEEIRRILRSVLSERDI